MKAQTQAWFVCTLLLASMTMFMSKAEASGPINVIYALSGNPSFPLGSLVADTAGNLYGTSLVTDGGRGCGTVFKLSPQSGGGWQFTVIHTFSGSGGCQPSGGLIIDASGNLYGTTSGSGASGGGTVFVLQPKGTGWIQRNLHNFGSGSTDVSAPSASLIMDAAGNLYGTGSGGGTSWPGCGGRGCGGVFKISRSGSQFIETVLYNFTGGSDGGQPADSLVFDDAGNLYGTTTLNSVFELSPSSGGEWNETTLYNFTNGADGGRPYGGLVFDHAGNLYGTTQINGNNGFCNGVGCGTVFELTPQGPGKWAFSVLFAFDGTNGGWPRSSLTLDSGGNLYGTGTFGGKNSQGVVFKLSQSNGTWTETFASFNFQDGGVPSGPLLLKNGFLFGTAEHGGKGNGVVFDIKL